MPTVELHATQFDPWGYLATRQAQQQGPNTRSGANAIFVGTMRDFNEGDDVQSLYLEHYPGMTERCLQQIAIQALQQWSLDDVLIVHRTGLLLPSEAIVLVAVWSAHRAAAFEACRHIMEILKHKVPFWKKEVLANGAVRWVEKNTAG